MSNYVLMKCSSSEGERIVMLCLDPMTKAEAEHAIRWQNLYPNPAIEFLICRKMARVGAFYDVMCPELIYEPEQGYLTRTAWLDFLRRTWRLGRG